jgi:hypothetical protein
MAQINPSANGPLAQIQPAARSSLIRRHPVLCVAGLVVGAVVVAGVVKMLPDIVRYVRLKRM